jgi:hypothetical protein
MVLVTGSVRDVVSPGVRALDPTAAPAGGRDDQPGLARQVRRRRQRRHLEGGKMIQ